MVELVAAFEGGGEDEEAIHIELDGFRLEGEWFDGTDTARAAIERIFGPDPLEWEFSYDPDGAAKWLDHLRFVCGANYIRNSITREIGILRTATEPSWVYDLFVFRCRYLAETGNQPTLLTQKKDGNTVGAWLNPETDENEILPAYTSSVGEALLAWPDDLRPATWEGSPIECCLAALKAIRARLPKVARRS